MKFNDEQLRVAANLSQYYGTWLQTKQELEALGYSLSWKTKDGVDYLRRRGPGSLDTSEGVRSAETEQRLAEHQAHKAALAQAERLQGDTLAATCRQYVALRMGTIASAAARILREADLRGYLGSVLFVVGTNAMAAYELEAGSRFAVGMDSTEDFDFAWSGESKTVMALNKQAPLSLLSMLKSIDPTYTVNTERTFQVRNKDAYEVELVIAPSRAASLPRGFGVNPIPMMEQEWLLQGRQVEHVVCGRDRTPARIVAPDPRWFALQKLWMAEKPQRHPLKKPKDRSQGQALLTAVATSMPQYPLDAAFQAQLPPQLLPHFHAWYEATGRHLKPDSRGF